MGIPKKGECTGSFSLVPFKGFPKERERDSQGEDRERWGIFSLVPFKTLRVSKKGKIGRIGILKRGGGCPKDFRKGSGAPGILGSLGTLNKKKTWEQRDSHGIPQVSKNGRIGALGIP